MGRTFLILVDAHSKWLEVPVSTPSSQQAIKALRHIFSTHGLPEVLVTDNGSALTSMDFATFVIRNGFRHIRCAPYHPASNGLAERAVLLQVILRQNCCLVVSQDHTLISCSQRWESESGKSKNTRRRGMMSTLRLVHSELVTWCMLATSVAMVLNGYQGRWLR